MTSAAAMGNPITPLASLCLGVIRGWIRVARKGRGGTIDEHGRPWTRLPADQLRDQLAEEFQVEVSTRSVQRALKELEDANQVKREQRWKHRYKRDYWYALPDHHEDLERHSPRTISSTYQSQRRNRSGNTEATRTTHQVLTTPISNTHISSKPPAKTPDRQARGTKKGRSTALIDAIRACNARAQGKQPQGFAPGPTHRAEEAAGMDQQGRPQRQVWVGGVAHLVVDDPVTRPIK